MELAKNNVEEVYINGKPVTRHLQKAGRVRVAKQFIDGWGHIEVDTKIGSPNVYKIDGVEVSQDEAVSAMESKAGQRYFTVAELRKADKEFLKFRDMNREEVERILGSPIKG